MILTAMLASLTVSIDTRKAEANPVCKWYPSLCGYPSPSGGRTPTSWTISPQGVIDELEPLVQQGTAGISEYIRLGHAYWLLNNFNLAEARYKKALQLATTANDRQNKAIALAGLGDVNASTGNIHKAVSYFHSAITIFKGIGEKELANLIVKRKQEVQQQRRRQLRGQSQLLHANFAQ
jgi:tetratricopeptide (TPR) repeat protein